MRSSLARAVLLGLTRRFWIVGAATVTVCATLAAQAAGSVVEARYLSDATHAPAVTRVAPAPAPVPTAEVAAADASLPQRLVERNMFCSDCAGAGDPDPADAGALRSSLPLVLIATSLGTDPWATVRNTESGAQGAFGVGDRIPRVGAIAAIAGTWIEVANDAAAGRIERIELLAVAPAPGPGASGARTVAAAETAPASPFADRVNKIDDHTYEVDRQLVRELATSAGGQVKGVRVTPVIKDDKLAGLKVLVAKPDSVAAAVGLRPGDVIQTIDGRPIKSAQQMIDIMARLDEISSVQFDGTRRGKKEKLALELRLR